MDPSTLSDLLAAQARDRPDRPFVVLEEQDITYREIDEAVRDMAAWLLARGVERGDRVGIQLLKSVDEIVLTFAASRIGAVFVNLSYAWTPPLVLHALVDGGIRILFTDERRARGLVAEDLPGTLERLVVRGGAPDHAVAETWPDPVPGGAEPEIAVGPGDLAAILYTSGSTGWPKGAMLTHGNLLHGARCVVETVGNTEEDRLLWLMPLSFGYGLQQMTSMALAGGAVVRQRSPLIMDLIRTLERKRVTGIRATPTTWTELVRGLEETAVDLPRLRFLVSSGSPIPGPVLDRLRALFPGIDIHLLYGMTEGVGITSLPPERLDEAPGSIGVPLRGVDVWIIDHGVGVCDEGEVGEIVVRGPQICRGYWGNPGATAEILHPCPELAHVIGDEPVLFTGDLGRREGDIHWFVGRRDFQIKVGGVRVSPDEVEDLVRGSGLVEEVVAFASPDRVRGEAVHVAVRGRGGAEPDRKALLAHCRRVMPHHMFPAEVHVWRNPFPRTPNGKLRRSAILEICRKRLDERGAALDT